MRLACIGIGSNAIRLLCAGWEDGALSGVMRERRGTRLFAGLVNGALTQESMRSSVDAVAELARLARADGAREIFVYLTAAAANENDDESDDDPPNVVVAEKVAKTVVHNISSD